MTKPELIAALASQAGITKAQADTVLAKLADLISATLVAGDDITLPGLGKFSVVAKPARTGRNPHTGEAVEIPARIAAKFSAAKALKDTLNTD